MRIREKSRKDEYKSPKVREVRSNQKTRVQKKRVARKIYSKNVIQIE